MTPRSNADEQLWQRGKDEAIYVEKGENVENEKIYKTVFFSSIKQFVFTSVFVCIERF